MRLQAAFFANNAEVVDDLLNVTGGCWASTTVKSGAAAFGCRCVVFCDVTEKDHGQKFCLRIDADGPTGRQWIPAYSSHFTVDGQLKFMITPRIALPIEPGGGKHVYTVRLDDHDERIALPLDVHMARHLK
jgi:hypothetical protein